MSFTDTLRFALHALTAHRLRTFLSATGIAVGIAAVVLLTSIGDGIHRFVLSEFTQFGTNIINVSPGKTSTHGASVGAIGSARLFGFDLLERLWAKNRMDEDEAMRLAVEAQHRTRPRRRR